MASLRSNPKFAALQSHEEALKLAIAPGNSRHTSPNRGLGFRPMFIGLANRKALLRFRTGDQSLTIDGTSPALSDARAAQKRVAMGFVVTARCQLG
jgi:hypothetical protein